MFKCINKEIKDDDLLGRAVFSSASVKRAKKGNFDFHIFFIKGSNNISVDRLGFCSKKKITGIQDKMQYQDQAIMNNVLSMVGTNESTVAESEKEESKADLKAQSVSCNIVC